MSKYVTSKYVTWSMIAFVVLAIAAPGIAGPVTGHRHYEVYPGSAFKLVQMLDRSQWSYVADNADAFYHHPVGFLELDDAQRKQLTGNFKTRNAIVEGDMHSGSTTGDVKNLQSMLALGMTPTAAIVNQVPPDPAGWQQRIAGNAKLGATTYLMLAPHVVYRTGWNDAKLDYARTLIGVSGCSGSGVDAPTYLFLHRGAKYAQAIYDQRNYTAAQGKKFMYVLSPNESNAQFLADSEQVIRALEDNDAEPDSYAVELYGKRPIELTPESVLGPGGSKPAASTILGVAYYLLKHRNGEPGTLTLHTALHPLTPILTRTPVLLTNSSTWLDYAPVVKATISGDSKGWSVTFAVGGQDITQDVLGDGYLFYKTQRLLPGTSRQIEVRIVRTGRTKSRRPTVTLQALPHTGSAPMNTLVLTSQR